MERSAQCAHRIAHGAECPGEVAGFYCVHRQQSSERMTQRAFLVQGNHKSGTRLLTNTHFEYMMAFSGVEREVGREMRESLCVRGEVCLKVFLVRLANFL